MTASKVGAALPDGAWVAVACETTGDSVTSDAGTSKIWERLSDGTYVPNSFVETGADGWTPGVPRCDSGSQGPSSKSSYNRQAAVDYARGNYTNLNVGVIPKCTYFASAVLEAGGINTESKWTPESTTKSDQASKLLYRLQGKVGPTKRWASADFLKNYLVKERKIATIAEVSLGSKNPGAELGDLIMYDWGGVSPGVIDHVAVVTGVAADGTLLVTQKENDYIDKGWNWSASDDAPISSATPGTRAYLIHITF
ncbi:amidase domain-containing protein [Microbacterium ureisolvens]|uniref:Amidase domain-containing protein n=2 Tax=Microbacterium ureisolvens TaxID=2781186 RepID=A0ABS7HXR6_9MICO|nr:amidase domain-containing protein [Microbacterium ureisolvens]